MENPPSLTCCGEILKTPFCPQCGSKAEDSPLRSLLRHLEIQVSKAQVELDKITKNERFSHQIPRYQRILEKWTRWRDALAAGVPATGLTISEVRAALADVLLHGVAAE